MATKTYCICGNRIKRTRGRRSKKAHDGKGSARIRRYGFSNTHICRSCMREYLQSRPSHDTPNKSGRFTLCDFCNAEINHPLIRAFTKPTIFRWIGRVSRSSGNTQDVCNDCRNELHEFINTKQTNTEE